MLSVPDEIRSEFIPRLCAAFDPAISHNARVHPSFIALRSEGLASLSLVNVMISISYCNRSQSTLEQFVIEEKPAITNLPE